MRRLLIFTAEYTGHGHKSISDALMERLKNYPDIEILTIDGFDLMNKLEKTLAEKTYGPITRMPPQVWKWSYDSASRFQSSLYALIELLIRESFEKLILDFKPDCMLSVHPIFLGTVLDLIEGMGLKVPLIAHEADLIDIADMWFDPRFAMVLTPSRESYEVTLRHIGDAARVHEVGFPVRSRFMGLRGKEDEPPHSPLTITVMSGSEGSGSLKKVVRRLLENTDAKVNVICGRNKSIRKKLRHEFAKKYYGRLNAMGFVESIQDVMAASDVLIMRASPNSVMEAVALNKPVILFGQLAGQELHNPDMLQSHGLALYCPEPEALPGCIAKLMANDGAEIKRIRECQRAYAPGDAAAETAKFLNDFIVPYPW